MKKRKGVSGSNLVSSKTVSKLYKEMVNSMESKDGRNVNCYTCEKCNYNIKTVYDDKGGIPEALECEKCHKKMVGSGDVDIYPEAEPTWSWYRPTFSDCLKMRTKSKAPILNHVLKGGLLMKKVES